METRLVPYETLSLVQKQQLDALQVHPEQLAFSGDIYCALNSLLVNKHLLHTQGALGAMRPAAQSGNFYGPSGQTTSNTTHRRVVIG